MLTAEYDIKNWFHLDTFFRKKIQVPRSIKAGKIGR
jgi:hypothetical protein